MKAGAIIAAAGRGLRMGLETEKQFLALAGIPVLARSVNIFAGRSEICSIVVVVPPGRQKAVFDLLKQYCDTAKIVFADGGDTRQGSVSSGLQALPQEAELVCIHDAARPLASAELLDKLLDAAARTGAAIPVIPAVDTLKEVDENGFIKRTQQRDGLFRAQTPQVFLRPVIAAAYKKAAEEGLEATDDAALVELCGRPVLTVPGEDSNLKITTPLDLSLAEMILQGDYFK